MDKQSRTHNTIRNILWGNAGNIVILLLQFASRTVFIYTIGISYLGVYGLFTNVLGVLSFAELGIGVAMNYSLYKPMANQDHEKLKSIMLVYKKAYRMIAIIITCLGLLLLPFLPYIIRGGENLDLISVYYLIFLFNTVSSYFITYKYSMLFVDQKNYVLTNINTIAQCIIIVIQIVVLTLFKNFLVYLLVRSGFQLAQKVFTSLYIDKQYPFLLEKNVKPLDDIEKEGIKTNVKALIIHKIGEISVHQTDNIIISAFISINLVGLVSNYVLLLTSVSTFMMIIINGVTASLGNLIATESKQRQLEILSAYNFVGFWLYGFATISFIVLVQPFITLWIGADKQIDNLSMVLIMANYYFLGQRITILNFKTVGGIFKQDRVIPIVQAVINLTLSIILVLLIGLPGIFIATLIQGLIANIWRPMIVYEVLFQEKATKYYIDSLKYVIVTAITALLMLLISYFLLNPLTITRFATMVLFAFIIPNFLFYLLFKNTKEFKELQGKAKVILKGMNNFA